MCIYIYIFMILYHVNMCIYIYIYDNMYIIYSCAYTCTLYKCTHYTQIDMFIRRYMTQSVSIREMDEGQMEAEAGSQHRCPMLLLLPSSKLT